MIQLQAWLYVSWGGTKKESISREEKSLFNALLLDRQRVLGGANGKETTSPIKRVVSRQFKDKSLLIYSMMTALSFNCHCSEGEILKYISYPPLLFVLQFQKDVEFKF